jgi:hypothetical protein
MRAPDLITHTALTLVIASMLPAAPVEAQQSFAAEVRGSLTRPSGEFGDPGGMEATGKAGFGLDALYSFDRNLSAYVGWSRESFGCRACDDGGFVSSGFELGAKYTALQDRRVLPWVRAGLLLHELDADAGTFQNSSDLGFGFQAAVGVDIPMTPIVSLAPAVRYQIYQAEFDVVGSQLIAQENVSSLALDLGVSFRFTTRGEPLSGGDSR